MTRIGEISSSKNAAAKLAKNQKAAAMAGPNENRLRGWRRMYHFRRTIRIGTGYVIERRMEEWIDNGYVDIDPNSYNISPTAFGGCDHTGPQGNLRGPHARQ
ncbi:hypothetical protein NKY70_30975 [Sinorhizobium meliloti]|uniref:hypothetical protein n=1 Tax=Rhizobium meliloti TaxID=382 RepID=UPI003D65BA39